MNQFPLLNCINWNIPTVVLSPLYWTISIANQCQETNSHRITDVTYFASSYNSVAGSFLTALSCHSNTVTSIVGFLEALDDHGIRKLIFSSLATTGWTSHIVFRKNIV